ncbi:MAG: hypothetical protein EHM23_34105, partial [Acidobacteria bacterium]
MPGGDRTGPLGLGPMTGRAAGYCAGYRAGGFMNFIPGHGFFGRGRGRGGHRWRNWFCATGLPGWQRAGWGWPPSYGWPSVGWTRDQELDALNGQAMKIAVTATAPDLQAQIDPRFGRCPYFLIVETDDLSFQAVENPNLTLSSGAGIQSAQLLAEH